MTCEGDIIHRAAGLAIVSGKTVPVGTGTVFYCLNKVSLYDIINISYKSKEINNYE